MKIAFYDESMLAYTPDTPFERPLGGTESAVAYLSAALAARGHEVTIVNRVAGGRRVRGVTMAGAERGEVVNLGQFDALVCVTRPLAAKLRRAGFSGRLILWQHMSADAALLRGFADPAERAGWDDAVFVSDHARHAFAARFGLNGITLRNAASPGVLAAPIEEQTFLDRGQDPVLVYASAPGRGLDLLLAAFAAARERLPGLRLQIFSDEGIYHRSGDADGYSAVYALARAIPGVEFTGSVSQVALGRAFAAADLLAYPTIFLETSCIVAMEAAACGCLFVGSDYGALRETLAGYGAFLPLGAMRGRFAGDYAQLLVATVAAARADPGAYRRRRREQIAFFRATHSWERRAEEWEAWLKSPPAAGRRSA